jgi:mRNA interferase MazF
MHKGEVWRVRLPFGGGREQAGERPAIVIQDDAFIQTLPLVLIVPLTGEMAASRFAGTLVIQPDSQNGLTVPSVALVFQRKVGSSMSEIVTQQTTIHYDAESDILYILIREGEEEEYVEIADNITLELDENGQVIGIEIEDASKMLKAVPELLGAMRN